MANKPVLDYGDLPDTFLVCRDLQHNWDERTITYRAVNERLEGKGRARALYVRTVKCARCKTMRAQKYLASTFERVGASYDYVDGYLQPGTRADPGALRRAAFERYTGGTG